MTQSTPETPATPADPQEPAAAAPETPATPPAAAEWDGKVESLPEGVQRLIGDLRNEAASSRVNAKQTAAAEAKQALANDIGRLIGLVPDETPVDQAELTKQITQSQTEARDAKVALAVFQVAADAGGDPKALLDSSSFLAKVASLDPTDSAAITTAITEAIAANPRLGVAAAVPPGMKPNPAQGRSASPPLGINEQIAAAQAAGDMKTVMRLKAQQTIATT